MANDHELTSIEGLEALKNEILASKHGDVAWHLGRLYAKAERLVQDNPSQATHVRTLGHVYGAHTCRPITNKKQRGSVLRSETADKHSSEHWTVLPVESYKDIWNQAQIETNHEVRVHLFGALWESRTIWSKESTFQLSVPDLARMLVEECIKAIRVEISGKDELKSRGHQAVTYLEIAAFVGWRLDLIDLLIPLVPELIEFARTLQKGDAPHWAESVCEVLAWVAYPKDRLDTVVTDSQLKELHEIAQKVQERFENETGSPDPEDAFNVVIRIENILTKQPIPDNEYYRRLGDSHKRRAEQSKFPGFAVGGFFLDAASAYAQAGMREAAAEMKAASRRAVGNSVANGEMKKIEVRQTISIERMEEILDPYFSEAVSAIDVLGRLGQRLFAISIETGEAARPISALSSFIPIQPIVDDRLRATQPSLAEGGTYEQKQTWARDIGIANQMVLRPAFEKLREVHSLCERDIYAVISHSPFWELQDLPFLKRSSETFIAGDYFSAVHLLVPRIEQLIRRILIKLGLDATALKDGELKERPLGELLREAQIKKCFPNGLVELLQATLSEEWGFNLRNRIAHGLADPGECGYLAACRVIHLAILLNNLREEDAPMTSIETFASKVES